MTTNSGVLDPDTLADTRDVLAVLESARSTADMFTPEQRHRLVTEMPQRFSDYMLVVVFIWSALLLSVLWVWELACTERENRENES